jgi:allophanate hydrolase subunit 1
MLVEELFNKAKSIIGFAQDFSELDFRIINMLVYKHRGDAVKAFEEFDKEYLIITKPIEIQTPYDVSDLFYLWRHNKVTDEEVIELLSF